MRVFLTISMASALLLRMCGDEPEDIDEPPSVETTPAAVGVHIEASADVAQPRHEGTVIIAEDHAVEVVTRPDEVRAYVVDVHGEAPPPAETTVVVNVHTAAPQPHPVTLTWNAEVGYYVAPLVEVEPVPGPLNVVLTVGGRPRLGHVETYVVLNPPPAVHVEAAAPRPHVDVHVAAPRPPRPHVDIHIQPPRPPSAHVDVRIGAQPRPRVRVREHRGKFKHRKHRRRGGRTRVRIR